MVASLIIKSLCLLFLMPLTQIDKEFKREYYASGNLKAEGWIQGSQKEGYWTYYYNDGSKQKKGHYHKDKKKGYWYFYSEEKKLSKEGHYIGGKKNGWWIFYENNNKTKIQFENGKREGFALVYINKKLQKAIKYEEDQKMGEWSSFWSFKKDNPQVKF